LDYPKALPAQFSTYQTLTKTVFLRLWFADSKLRIIINLRKESFGGLKGGGPPFQIVSFTGVGFRLFLWFASQSSNQQLTIPQFSYIKLPQINYTKLFTHKRTAITPDFLMVLNRINS